MFINNTGSSGETLSKTLSCLHMGSQSVSALKADWPSCSGCISRHMSGPALVSEREIFIQPLLLRIYREVRRW